MSSSTTTISRLCSPLGQSRWDSESTNTGSNNASNRRKSMQTYKPSNYKYDGKRHDLSSLNKRLDKIEKELERQSMLLWSIDQRQVRIETRLCKLMQRNGMDPTLPYCGE